MQNNSVDLIVDKVVVVNNELSINVSLVNNSNKSFIIYKPKLESMVNGILYIHLTDCKDSSNYDLYPFDIIADVEAIYLTSQNTIVLNKGESFATTFKMPVNLKKGKYRLCVGLNYADTNFVLKEALPVNNLLNENLRFCRTVKIR
jgi:hypothetical protein